MHIDEENRKSSDHQIFSSKQTASSSIDSTEHSLNNKESKTHEKEYTKIRVKKISYLQNPAIAIYFQNMT